MLNGPELAPKNGADPKQLIVLLHGYGADGGDLIGLAPYFAAILPDALFIAPHAPQRCEMGGGGRQWFTLAGWEPGESWPEKLWPEIVSSGKILDAWLNEQLAEHNLQNDQLALVGFSQGTMMALHVGLRRAAPLAAIVGYSGALLGPEHLTHEITARPPVMLVHGDQDPVVAFAEMAAAEKILKINHVPVFTLARPGLPHGIDDEGTIAAARWMKNRLMPKEK